MNQNLKRSRLLHGTGRIKVALKMLRLYTSFADELKEFTGNA